MLKLNKQAKYKKISKGKCWHRKRSTAGENVLNRNRKNYTQETDSQQISLCALQKLIRNSTHL